MAHEQFIEEPRSAGDQVYSPWPIVTTSSAGETICRERCRYELIRRDDGWLLLWDSTFTPDRRELVFGDQEEMGLGVRMATPLAVKNGGTITNSNGQTERTRMLGAGRRLV